MRHRNTGRQFGRNSSHRRALFRNLVTSLLEHGKVETTEAKAKEIRGIADKMITLGKRGDLHAKRLALAYIQSRDVVAKLFDELAPRSANRNGGYTRVIKTRIRLGDSAPMAVIELVDREGAAPAAPKKAREAAPAAAEPTKKAAPVAEEPKAEAAPAEPVAEGPAAEAAAGEEPKAEAAGTEAAPEASAEGEKTK